jgi:type IV secretion system protein VirB10
METGLQPFASVFRKSSLLPTELLMRLASLLMLVPILCPAAEIPQGSHVALRLVNSVTTKTAKEGDFVYMTTATPIAGDNRIVVPVGSYVQGVVVKSVRSSRVKGTAELGIRIDTLTFPDGRVIHVTPKIASVDPGMYGQSNDKEGQVHAPTSKGRDAMIIGGMGGYGAITGAEIDRTGTGAGIGAGAGGVAGLITVLLTRGHEVELRQGATVDVVFDRAVPVE